MNAQLQEIIEEHHSASTRLERLRASIPLSEWSTRSERSRWSPAECVAHLNLTAEAFLLSLSEAIANAPRADRDVRYRRDAIGWVLWKMMAPPVRLRTKTTAGFVPTSNDGRDVILERFASLQKEQIAIVERCEGLRVDRVKMHSPFDSRVRYNVFSALSILPRHQHRHLWQAERVADRYW